MSTRCLLCKGTKVVVWKKRNLNRRLIPEDLQITDNRYGVTLTLLRCDDCGFIFAEGEEIEELTALYTRLEDPSYEEGKENRSLQMRWLLDRIMHHKPAAKTLLDIGAGTGLLVAEAKHRGLDAVGIEPSRSLAAVGQRSGLKVLNGTFPHSSIADRRFDIVCLIDVIEHLADFSGMLRECHRVLAPGGLFVVVTPDVRSLVARLLGRRWWHFRLAHVLYFDRNTMTAALRASGFSKLAFFRAQWFFPIRYVAERLAVYLPLSSLNRRLTKLAALNRLYSHVISVNPRDSMVFLAKRHDSPLQ